MTVQITPRWGLTVWDDDDDPWSRAEIAANFVELETYGAKDEQGLEADRPTLPIRGRWYFATDTGNLYRDNGTTWDQVAALVGGRLNIGTATGAAGTLDVTPGDDLEPALAMRARAGQSAAMIEGLADDGTPTFRVYAAGIVRLGDGAPTGNQLGIKVPGSGRRGIHVQAAAGQDLALLELTSSGGATLSLLDPLGRLSMSKQAVPSSYTTRGTLYVSTGGNLRYRGTAGTDTLVAPA